MLLGLGFGQCDANGDGDLDVLDVVIEVDCILTDCWEGGSDTTQVDVCVDYDGNVYETIKIGEQLWMAENLKVIHYNDGSEITHIINSDYWGSYVEGQYGVYDNDPANADIYGNLYNFAVIEDDRGVCPEGWHVPSNNEYTVLTDYLGGAGGAGGKMKEAGLDHWNYYSDEITEDATNESGFTGLPAGYRGLSNGLYGNVGYVGYFWSSSEYGSNDAWYRRLSYSSSVVYRDYDGKHYGFSIRCLGD